MAILRCKMCGGTLEVFENSTVTKCEYCGTKQTIPTVDDEKKLNLFSRANRLRAACEFDKAAGVYESIVADFPEEPEAYWGLVLCKFGIEYVDDPATGKKIPTCHRSSFDSLMDDADFDMVMETSDSEARRVYREEAKAIEEIRRGIVEVSNKEEPYDIFICYKETDDIGNRTVDSVLAQDIYDMLTENKYRVFFSRISLEDKLGVEYEPYIFAALNSARIMLAIGTDYEYYNAVWVKNEWSRFLQLMTKDRKKMLIPCYKNIDAYDIPKEFAKLQAQDLGKIGAMQDLLRGIKKLMPKDSVQSNSMPANQQVQQNGNANLVAPLLERAFIFLEDKNWKTADEYFERVLDLEPRNGNAYFGKILSQAECSNQEELLQKRIIISELPSYGVLSRYGEQELMDRIIQHDDTERMRSAEEQRLAEMEKKYQLALRFMHDTFSVTSMERASELFTELGDYKDSQTLLKKCDADTLKNMIAEKEYNEAVDYMKSNTVRMTEMALGLFNQHPDYKDAALQAQECERRIVKLRREEEEAGRARKKVMLEREITALQRKLDNITSFNSADYDRLDIKRTIKQKKSELKTVTRLVEQDEENRKTNKK